jgi:DNA replication protein DnaD
MKLPEMIFSFVQKNPIKSGFVAFVIYLCCFEDVLGTLKNLMNAGSLEMPKGKEEEKQEQAAPEMDDVSMFSESLQHNAKIANLDSNVEDIINDVHK